MKSQPKEKLSAIEKTLEILVTFADNDRELGTVEVSELTGIHKATASRILSTLLGYGLVSQSDETKKYNLGPLAYRLGTSQASQAIREFVLLSQSYIDELRDKVMETISLELWTENKTVACYLAESRNPLRVAMAPADVLPLHAPAGAKAILSYVSSERLERLLPDEFTRFTDNTITSKADLLLRLGEFNKQGYSIDNEELHHGIYAIGVPIFDYLSKPVAAVSAVVPASRITVEREAEIVAQLKRTSRMISKAIKKNGPLFPCP
ncbi:MAG: IclR family KDG regulon transcriptional repressor [Halioglobus sp.]|jgi:IclR family KDG regulon transcriptional repressor